LEVFRLSLASARPFLLVLCIAAASFFPLLGPPPIDDRPSAVQASRPAPGISEENGRTEVGGGIPLAFEPNRGQADPAVRFLSRGAGYTLGLGTGEALFAGSHGTSPVRMRFPGSDQSTPPAGVGMLPGIVNYLLGSHPEQWLTGIPTYAGVAYEDLYPGIDLVFRANGGRFEYDFIVAPGADPGAITVAFPDVESLAVDPRGSLVIGTPSWKMRQPQPVIYQETNGIRQEVIGGFELLGGRRVVFDMGPYDPSLPLVIDPVVYATFLGGEGYDAGLSIDADVAGNAYVTGFAASTGFPTSRTAFQPGLAAGVDVFVTKLDPMGSAAAYSTYIGGGGDEWGSGIAVDASGEAYVTGRTDSANFPTTPGAFDTSFNGAVDSFALKLNDTGSALEYSTYLGGSGFEHDRDNIIHIRAAAIDVDGSGNAYVTGQTTSPNFPTARAIDPTHGGGHCPGGNLVCSDVYVTKLNPTGSALVYSTFLGGSDEDAGRDIFVDGAGAAYVVGEAFPGFPITPGAFQPFSQGFESFVTKVNAAGSALAYSTFLGGELTDQALGVTADASGNAYVTGATTSFEFPTTAGAFQTNKIGNESDAFVTKLNATGSGLVYSTYVGERETDEAFGIGVDATGNAHIGGHSQLGAPVLPCPFANYDAFTASLNTSGSALLSATCLGGHRDEFVSDMALDPKGNTYVTGRTNSSGAFSTIPFPTTAGAFQPAFAGGATDAFVIKVGDEGGGNNECAITGTEGKDTLTGTSGPDVICGLGGNDVIDGMGGNDILLGGPGNDRLIGGPGDDTLDGGDGRDTASYAPAPTGVTVNLLTGTASGHGNDSLVAVEDVIGSRFADSITGEGKGNRLRAGGGNDAVHGQGGNDIVGGGSGNDTMTGGERSDRLDGGVGTDSLDGGPGTDTCLNGEILSNCE
jgi:Ca2+-binding RTX toxin-like protein